MVAALILGLLLVVVLSVAATLVVIQERPPTVDLLASPEPEPSETSSPESPASATPTADEEPTGSTATSAAEVAARYGDAVWRVEATGCGFASSGTAFVIDDHLLLTNWHVVANDATPVVISRDGNTRLNGQVIGWSSDPDVAVVEVSQALGVVLEMESATVLREGQDLVALGYPAPEGDFAVTQASIRSFQTSGGVRVAIRAAGALDKGNSGGPALTMNGTVAGVATKMEPSGGFQWIPILYTYDHLNQTVQGILERPAEQVSVDCNAAGGLPTLPDDWDFEPFPTPEPPTGPQEYGDDSELDGLWAACAQEDWGACDTLFYAAPSGSDYELFGATCGDREAWYGFCEQMMGAPETVGPSTYGDDDQLDALWDRCDAEDWAACDELYWSAASGTEYELFGSTCGDRTWQTFGSCESEMFEEPSTYGDDPELDRLWEACEAEDWVSCDDLYYFSATGTEYESFGSTCGGRTSETFGSCEFEMFEEPFTYGDDLELDGLWEACEAEDWVSCDDLYWSSGEGTEYESFGSTCGDRTLPMYGSCEFEMFEEPFTYGDDLELDGLWEACEAEDWAACDTLYTSSDFGSEYEEFGSTCGYRVEPTYGSCDFQMAQ